MDTSIFYMDEQVTLSSFLTTVTAFLAGFIFILGAARLTKIRQQYYTFGIGLFFLTLAFDEYFEVHPYVNTLIKSTHGGALGYLAEISWVFPLFIFVVLVGVLFVLFIKNIKTRNVRMPFLIGMGCYMLVLILEIIGGNTYGQDIYIWFVGLEEGFEMIGGSLFLLSALNVYEK